MLPIVWRARARDDLAKIILYIAEKNPPAARRLHTTIQASVLPVARHPYVFKGGRVTNTREIVVRPNYVVVYRVTASAVEVLNVLHARQKYR